MHPGRRTFALPVVLAVALAVGPVPSGRAAGEREKSRSVQEQLQQLDASLKKAFDKVGEELKALQRDLQGMKEERVDTQSKLADGTVRSSSPSSRR